MNTFKRIVVAALITAAVPVLAGCSGQTAASGGPAASCTPKYGKFDTVTAGTLTIATYDGMPYYTNAEGKNEGIDAGFLDQFAKDSCLEAKWNVSPAAAVIQSVASKRADVAAGGWYSTPERGKIVNLSNPTYVELPTILSKTPTDNVEDLKGKKVGTVTGYTWVDELTKVVGTGNLSQYQSSDAVLADLNAGRIQYAFLGSIDSPYLVKKNKAYSAIKSELMKPNAAISSSVNPALPNYPSSKGNTALTNALDKAITAAHDDGSFAKILTSYGLDASLVDTSKYQK